MGSLLSSAAEGLADLLYPHRCVLCDLPGQVLCEDCEADLDFIDQHDACPRCGAPHGRIVCTECARMMQAGESFSFTAARAAGSFDAAFSRIATAYKDQGERALALPIARLLAAAAGPDWREWADAVTFVPASADAYLRRGFDHMEDVAKHFARLCRLPLVDVLVRDRRKVADQRSLSRDDRRLNASAAFRIPNDATVRQRLDGIIGKHVILIDDVFTTGATLDSAAQVLLDRGVCEVRVCVLARVW